MPDINDVFVPGQSSERPPKKGKSGIDAVHVPGGGANPQFGDIIQTGLDQKDFRFQLKSNADNEKLRAQDQGFWETLGIKAANFVPNVLTGMGEMAGYAGALLTEWGDERDYSNSLTELMQKWKNPFGEIYRENPQQVFDMTDSAWWIDNLGGLMESATQFAIPGAGISKAFGTLARAATWSRNSGKVLNTIAHTGSAASLAYMEGAMSGYRVFETAYNNQYRKALDAGMDGQQAHQHATKIASDAAATTVQMNTIMNTALNMTALAPLFRNSEQKVMDFMRTNARREKGESAQQFLTRIAKLAEEKGLNKSRVLTKGLLGESVQEGIEEVNTQYAEAEGARVGEGKDRSLMEALTDFEGALKDVSNEEGILNFALGALGGVAQTVMLDNLPIHKVLKDETAKTYQRVSSRTLNQDGTRRYFDSLSEAISKDFDWHDKKMKALKTAVDKGDKVEAEMIRRDMFNVLALNAVQLGMGENWINTFREIAETPNSVDRTDLPEQLEQLELAAAQDPEKAKTLQQDKEALIESYNNMQSDAVTKGLAANRDDMSYRERALQAIEDIKYYQRLHDDIYSRYNTPEEEKLGIADYIFHNAANLYAQEQVLQRETMELDRKKVEHTNTMASLPARSETMFRQAAVQYADAADTYSKIMDRIRGDINEFNNALSTGDEATLSRLLEKYRILGHVGKEQVAKMKEHMDRQYQAAEQGMRDAVERLEKSTGYEQWKEKNEKGTLEEYMKKLNEAFGTSNEIKETEIQLERLRGIVETNRKQVSDMMSSPGNVKKVISKLRPEIEKRNKEVQERYKNSEVQRELEKNAAAATVEISEQNISRKVREVTGKIEALNERLEDLQDKLKATEEELRQLELTRKSVWDVRWKYKMYTRTGRVADLKSEMAAISKQISEYETYLNELQQGVVPGVKKSDTPAPPVQTTPAPEQQTEVPAPVPKDPLIAAAEKYEALLMRLPGDVHGIFAEYEALLRAGTEHDIESFMTRADVVRALEEGLAGARNMRAAADALAEYMSKLPAKEEVVEETDEADEVEEETEEETEEEVTEETTTEELWDKATAVEIQSAPTMTETEKTANAADVEMPRRPIHDEDKVSDILKVNNSSLEYVDYKDKKKNYRMAGKELNPNLPYKILDPAELKPGTKVILQLDTEFKGTVRQPGYMNATKEMTYADYLDASGNVQDYENVPIKITDENGTTLGYLPTMDWLTDRYAGTDLTDNEGYRNIVAQVEQVNPDGSVSIVDNVALQKGRLTKIRSMVAGNKNTAGMPVTMSILSKGPGKVIMNVVEQKDGTFRPVKGPALSFENSNDSLLPDPTLKLGKVQQGKVLTGKNYSVAVTNKEDQLSGWDNAPVVLLPTANGTLTAAPLYLPDLSDPGSLMTVQRAILLYLRAGDKAVDEELNKLYEMSGIDLRNAADLREFIMRQYTHLNRFDETATALDPDKEPRFLFNITEPTEGKARIMVGWSHSGQRPVYANLSGNNLNKDFVEMLQEGLATRQKNVNFATDSSNGINATTPFSEIVYNGNTWKKIDYDNYNQFVKANATTYVYGRNQQNGKYRYTANPVIQLDSNSLRIIAPENTGVQVVETPKETPPPISSPEVEDVQDLLGNVFGYMPNSTVSSITPGETMQPISMEVLKDLYNFTPVSKRNDKTPEQVYRDMLRQGLPYLADGHNPFLKCG